MRSPRRPWWFSVLACTALMLAVPHADTAMLLDLSLVMILSLALSMGFLWGYVGILSFGQTIFFGLGGCLRAVQPQHGPAAGGVAPPSCPCCSRCCWATS